MARPDVVIDDAALERFLSSPAGPVGQLLATLGQRVTQEAKARAPVGARSSKYGHPSGYLRSRIGWELKRDTIGLYVDVSSPARTSAYSPHPGEPYALHVERPSTRKHGVPDFLKATDGPYLVPALESILGSL